VVHHPRLRIAAAHPRIERWPPTFLRAALDGSVKRAQIQSPNQCPDRPRWMILADQTFHIDCTPTHLLPIYVAN
jgi:hypothetical protein